MYDKHYVGLDLTGFENNGTLDKVSRVTLLVDDENAVTAGDDTGMELVADCPHATQAIANALLSQLKGYQYRMYGADGANIDPAAELGDGATAGGIYSVISSIEDDGSGYMGVSAPGEAEESDEFPGSGPMTKEFNRKLATVRSSITKTAEQIRLEVINEIDGVKSSITQTAESITSAISKTYATKEALSSAESTLQSTISQTATSIIQSVSATYITQSDAAKTYRTEEQVNAAIKAGVDGISLEFSKTYLTRDSAKSTYRTEAQVSAAVKLGVEGISLDVDNGEKSSTIKLRAGETEISSQEIKFTGNVVFASDLSTAGQTSINGENLMTGTVTASTIKGNTVQLMTNDGYLAGEFMLTASSSNIGGSALNIRSGALAMYSEVGDVFIKSYNQAQNTNYSFLQLTAVQGVGGVIYTRGHLIPSNDKTFDLGYSTCVYRTAYIANGVVSLSDRNEKRDIGYDLSRYDGLFDCLAPCSFRFTDGERVHIGLISQDVEEQMEHCGIDSMELAAFIKSPNEEGGYRYGLRYSEFISLLIDQVQKLKKRVKALEEAA